MPSPSSAGPRRPIVFAVLFTVLAPLLIFTAVRVAAYEATGFRTQFAGGISPTSAWPDVRRVMRDARRAGATLPGDAPAVARRAAGAYPLAFEPYFIGARVAERAGRYDQAVRLMEEARRRRPNFTPTRVHLLGYYSLANAYQRAIDEADFAIRIHNNTSTYILPAFARLVAADPKARDAIAVALSRGPIWEAQFYEVAANAGMTPADADALVSSVRARRRNKGDQAAQNGFLVGTFVRAGEYARARAIWAATAKPGTRATDDAAVVDPDFTGASGPPFGWKLSQSGDGVAERARAAGGESAHLSVTYYGSAPARLAEQVLVLRPGRYDLSFRARVDGVAEQVALQWRVLCLPGERPLATATLPLSAEPRTTATTFDVPAACRAQTLVLAGAPGDLPRTVSSQIYEVRISPAGDRT